MVLVLAAAEEEVQDHSLNYQGLSIMLIYVAVMTIRSHCGHKLGYTLA
jgi:hypothetical protein